MATKIQWTDETWNPVIGCSKCSPGCAHCYAEKMAHRLAHMGVEGYGIVSKKKGGWTGKTYEMFYKDVIHQPLHWKKPRRVFVCSMGDLFHESMPFEWVDKVMAVIALCPQHTFQILTKRPERMREYFDGMTQDREHACKVFDLDAITADENWPLSNIWLGTTVCTQEEADKNLPILLSIPAAVRFVSIEPMLERIDLTRVSRELSSGAIVCGTMLHPQRGHFCPGGAAGTGVDWVIVGCESGSNRRPCVDSWVSCLVSECRQSDVPVFVKQLSINGKVSKDMDQWPEHLRVREFPTRGRVKQ